MKGDVPVIFNRAKCRGCGTKLDDEEPRHSFAGLRGLWCEECASPLLDEPFLSEPVATDKWRDTRKRFSWHRPTDQRRRRSLWNEEELILRAWFWHDASWQRAWQASTIMVDDVPPPPIYAHWRRVYRKASAASRHWRWVLEDLGEDMGI